jgi:hypothetical protein
MSKNIRTPDNVVAIIVDIGAPGGKFVIGRYAQVPLRIDVVAERVTGDEVELPIWPWQHQWQFYAVGRIKIRYLESPFTAT